MIKKELQAEQAVQSQFGLSLRLQYYLTEASCADKSVFGIVIRKTVISIGDEDSEALTGISYSREVVLSILEKLAQGQVTPVTMLTLIDEMTN